MSELEATAYHEAGHAVVAYELHLPRVSASIVPDDESLGHVRPRTRPFDDPERWRWDHDVDGRRWKRIEDEITCLFAGADAEARFLGARNDVGAEGDYHRAWRLIGLLDMQHDDEEEPFGNWLSVRASGFVEKEENWYAIEALAAELLERRELSAREVQECIRSAFTRWAAKKFPTPPTEEGAVWDLIVHD